jgi:GAF domain-containing protein
LSRETEFDAEYLRHKAAGRFLGEATRVLGRSGEVEVALAGIVQLAVPHFADWCLLDLLASDGQSYDRVAVGHHCVEAEKIATALKRRYVLRTDKLAGTERAIVERRPLMAQDIDDSQLRRFARDDEHLELAQSLRMRSAVAVPLLIGEEPIGALTLISSSRTTTAPTLG